MINTPTQKTVDDVICSRHSIRAFLPTPVAREDIEAILDVAARAPSGSNTQPWRVYVLTGATRDRLVQKIVDAYLDPAESATHTEEYAYYPRQWVSPYIERRRKVGWDLYALLGLTRCNDKPAQTTQLLLLQIQRLPDQ
ncbi:MAG: nitroreductase family protein, partial [Burkholderiaceae bacterium]